MSTLNSFMDESDFVRLRRDFWRDPRAGEELDAYISCKNDVDYKILKGLVPKSLVGKVTTGVGPPWQKSDTFFTVSQRASFLVFRITVIDAQDFAIHNPQDRILSETKQSFIIINNACHDVRLYSSEVDYSSLDKTTSAGMSYLHLLVIPTSKVYNVVSLSDSNCIEELMHHFGSFWKAPGSVDKVIKAIEFNMEHRYNEIIQDYNKEHPDIASQKLSHLDTVMSACRKSASELATKLRNEGGDLFFGFHAHPHASVGHLHMHVLLSAADYRKYSTYAHDWKTIPAEVVLNVLRSGEDSSRTPVHDTHQCPTPRKLPSMRKAFLALISFFSSPRRSPSRLE